MLCLAVVAGGTYALFTDTATVKNHLNAGKLNITLTRTSLTKTTLNADGFLHTPTPDTERKDFSGKTTSNAFDIENVGQANEEKIVPGTTFVAEFEIANNSDVAFGYWIDIVCTDASAGEDLAKQLRITVNSDDNSAFVGQGLTVKGDNQGYIDVVPIGEISTFTITVEFVDSHEQGSNIDHNDLAQGESIHFDLVVNAVQVKSNAPANP